MGEEVNTRVRSGSGENREDLECQSQVSRGLAKIIYYHKEDKHPPPHLSCSFWGEVVR